MKYASLALEPFSYFLFFRTFIHLTGYSLSRWNTCWQPKLVKPFSICVPLFNGHLHLAFTQQICQNTHILCLDSKAL